MLAFLDDMKDVAFIAGILIIVFFLFRRAVQQAKKGGQSDRPRPPRTPRPQQAKQPLQGETEKLLVELQEFGREIEGRLETRIQHLTRLISEADSVIEKLNAVVAASKNDISEDQSEGGDDAAAEAKGPLKERILSLAEEGLHPHEIAETVGKPLGEVELFLGLGRKMGEKQKDTRPS